jgi:hypothetical protein
MGQERYAGSGSAWNADEHGNRKHSERSPRDLNHGASLE